MRSPDSLLSSSDPGEPGPPTLHRAPVEIVIPVRNEEHDLASSVRGIIGLGTGLARGTIRVPLLRSPSPPGWPEQGQPADGSRRGEITSQLARFFVVGVASTLAFVVLYLLVAANLAATVVRFTLYRTWVFRGHNSDGSLR
jgi:hypothetical protein